MLFVHPSASEAGAPEPLGPFEHLRLEGAVLLFGGREIARLEEGRWKMMWNWLEERFSPPQAPPRQGDTWTTLKITPLAELQFETGDRRSAGYGPFNEVTLAAANVEAAGRVLAQITDDGLHDANHARWSALVITPSFSAHG